MFSKKCHSDDTQDKSRCPWIVRALGAAFRRLILFLGVMSFISLVCLTVIVSHAKRPAMPLPSSFVLTISLGDGAVEHPNLAGRYSFSGGGAPVFSDMIAAIDVASRDPRVKGLLVTMDGGSLNLAQIQEFRAALAAFRKTGRFADIYASSYGDMGLGLGAYYLASAFDEIWMQPLGNVSMAGLRAEVPFARAALDKIGVQPQFFARKEYKTLFESAVNGHMSPESRAMLTSLVDDLGDQMVAGIAADKGMGAADIRRLVDRGFFTDEEALAAGLVDKLDDYDALEDSIIAAITPKQAGAAPLDPDKVFVPLERYPLSAAGHGKPRAAIVYLVGTIASSDEMMGSPESATAEEIAGYISDAADDDSTKVIVLRIDSPGGSPEASETIRRAVLQAQKNGKKVIVSMGETAASGGYWVASPADRIFALPGTVTGSIGVAGGKVVIQNLWHKLGINWEYVQYGANAGLFSFNEPFTPEGEAIMNRMMDATYNAFVSRVAQGRHMSVEQVEKVARGRVWSGQQAQKVGLVDDLGGLSDALDYAARQVGAKDRRGLDTIILPQPKSQLEMLLEFLEGEAQVTTLPEEMSALSPFLKAYQAASLAAHGPLTLEPLRVRP